MSDVCASIILTGRLYSQKIVNYFIIVTHSLAKLSMLKKWLQNENLRKDLSFLLIIIVSCMVELGSMEIEQFQE